MFTVEPTWLPTEVLLSTNATLESLDKLLVV